jgi:hypothetical protein
VRKVAKVLIGFCVGTGVGTAVGLLFAGGFALVIFLTADESIRSFTARSVVLLATISGTGSGMIAGTASRIPSREMPFVSSIGIVVAGAIVGAIVLPPSCTPDGVSFCGLMIGALVGGLVVIAVGMIRE